MGHGKRLDRNGVIGDHKEPPRVRTIRDGLRLGHIVRHNGQTPATGTARITLCGRFILRIRGRPTGRPGATRTPCTLRRRERDPIHLRTARRQTVRCTAPHLKQHRGWAKENSQMQRRRRCRQRWQPQRTGLPLLPRLPHPAGLAQDKWIKGESQPVPRQLPAQKCWPRVLWVPQWAPRPARTR